MNKITDLKQEELRALRHQVRAEYEDFRARGLALDMTRGKPSPEQLDLANDLLALPGSGDYFAQASDDTRNYGLLQGLPEARGLFSKTIGAPVDRIAAIDNSSLALMHDCILWALLKGAPGSAAPWSQMPTTFICPVPGYDRHFARWTRPEGGYFVSVDVLEGTAKTVVDLARKFGLALTPAGATWPYGRDPQDRTLRLAPTFPPLQDVRAASEGIAICILLAAIEKLCAP